jgi:hypothetical protein
VIGAIGINSSNCALRLPHFPPKWNPAYDALLDIALDHLTLDRVGLCAAILEESEIRNIRTLKSEIDHAVDGLRRAGTQHMILIALLARAWLRFLTGTRTGPESAQSDLDEAWDIAERAPCRCSWRTFTCIGRGCLGSGKPKAES